MTIARLGSVECAGRGLFVLALGLLAAPAAAAQDQSRRFEEVRRFSAEEASQGIAWDRWLAGGFQVFIEGDPVFPEVF